MGIGNLNNNFGSLTAGGVNKTTNLKNTAKAETTVKNNVSFNADSLKSATLSDKEGVKFDSDNMKDNTEMLYAPKNKKEGFWSRFGRMFYAWMNKTGGVHSWMGGRPGESIGDAAACAVMSKTLNDKMFNSTVDAWGGSKTR